MEEKQDRRSYVAKENARIDESYNEKGDASHYDQDRLNTIVKMEAIWGTAALMYHCEITAFKYRERIGKKAGQAPELDLLKAKWYERAAKFYFDKIEKNEAVISVSHDRTGKKGLPW